MSSFLNVFSTANTTYSTQLIEPLTLLIQLGELEKKEAKTKIQIENYQLSFYPPGYLQGLYRAAFGANRDCIIRFKPFIEKAAIWYQPHKNHVIHEIFLKAARGLEKLKLAYANSCMVCKELNELIRYINYACITHIHSKDPIILQQKQLSVLIAEKIKAFRSSLTTSNGDGSSSSSSRNVEELIANLSQTILSDEQDTNPILPYHRRVKALWDEKKFSLLSKLLEIPSSEALAAQRTKQSASSSSSESSSSSPSSSSSSSSSHDAAAAAAATASSVEVAVDINNDETEKTLTNQEELQLLLDNVSENFKQIALEETFDLALFRDVEINE